MKRDDQKAVPSTMPLDVLSVRMALHAVQCGLDVEEALRLCEWHLNGADGIEESLRKCLRRVLAEGETQEPVQISGPYHGEEQ